MVFWSADWVLIRLSDALILEAVSMMANARGFTRPK